MDFAEGFSQSVDQMGQSLRAVPAMIGGWLRSSLMSFGQQPQPAPDVMRQIDPTPIRQDPVQIHQETMPQAPRG